VKIQNIFNSEEEILTPEPEEPPHITAEQPSEDIQAPTAEVPETTIHEIENIEPDISEPEVTEPKISEDDIIKQTSPKIIKAEPPQLPFTIMPDVDNLPVIDNFDELAVNDLWIGETPCKTDIFDVPMTLPNLSERMDGPFLTETLKATDIQTITKQPTYIFKSENGVTLKIVRPVIDYYNLSGRTYKEVNDDLFERRPLETLRQSQSDKNDLETENTPEKKSVTAADISGPASLKTSIGGLKDRFEIYPKQTELTIGFLVTLPQWKNYDFATTEDQAKWDDLFCSTAHHELGHLRIRLDIIAAALNGYAALPPAKSSDEMHEIFNEYTAKIFAIIDERQEIYHIYNGGGTRKGMGELPYADLPFPWLERERQSP